MPDDRRLLGLIVGLPVDANINLSNLEKLTNKYGFINDKKKEEIARNYIKLIGINTPSLIQEVRFLSGGNQQKILIGRGLLNNPRLLLLDEPTRGIDIGAKEGIYNLINGLSSKGISFIISSSHMPELLRICDRILVLFNGVPAALLTARKTDTKEILHYAFNEGQL